MDNKVWYVCYGSNLLEERFLCYIKGGMIPGNTRSERGAKDNTLPERSEKCFIDHKLFFSTPIEKWFGSGVAYIDPERMTEPGSRKNGTRGRKYLITLDQFLDVVRQENSLPAEQEINIDFETLEKEGSYIVFPGSYYGRLLYLGRSDGYPMYSFTCIGGMDEMEKAPLFGPYYDVIAAGLKESHNMTDKAVERYLGKYRQSEE